MQSLLIHSSPLRDFVWTNFHRWLEYISKENFFVNFIERHHFGHYIMSISLKFNTMLNWIRLKTYFCQIYWNLSFLVINVSILCQVLHFDKIYQNDYWQCQISIINHFIYTLFSENIKIRIYWFKSSFLNHSLFITISL